MLLHFFNFIIILFVVYLLWHVSKKFNNNSPIIKFVDNIFKLPSIFIPIGIYFTYNILKIQIDNSSRDSTFKIIDRGWILINKTLAEYQDKCPFFINSLYYDWQKKQMGAHVKNNINNDDWAAVNYLSTLIFQSWEDFLTSLSIDQTGSVVWIANYLQWTQSNELRNIWNVSKPNYAYHTQLFGDFLFSQTYKPKNANELQSFAMRCNESEEFKKIKEMRMSYNI